MSKYDKIFINRKKMAHRIEKINKLLIKDLSRIINELFCDKISFFSINDIQTTKDLGTSYVYVSSSDKKNDLVKFLNKNEKIIRYNLAKKITFRYVPKLNFIYDENAEKVNTVEELINKITHEA
jgi:ribosome-binding factor A